MMSPTKVPIRVGGKGPRLALSRAAVIEREAAALTANAAQQPLERAGIVGGGQLVLPPRCGLERCSALAEQLHGLVDVLPNRNSSSRA